MPGLLHAPEGSLNSYKLFYAFAAELVGTLVFSLYGSATTLNGKLSLYVLDTSHRHRHTTSLNSIYSKKPV